MNYLLLYHFLGFKTNVSFIFNGKCVKIYE